MKRGKKVKAMKWGDKLVVPCPCCGEPTGFDLTKIKRYVVSELPHCLYCGQKLKPENISFKPPDHLVLICPSCEKTYDFEIEIELHSHA